jgi:hypothetical protein
MAMQQGVAGAPLAVGGGAQQCPAIRVVSMAGNEVGGMHSDGQAGTDMPTRRVPTCIFNLCGLAP